MEFGNLKNASQALSPTRQISKLPNYSITKSNDSEAILKGTKLLKAQVKESIALAF
ncbi:MAG: hypothetical protein L0Z53_07000 [Acidobacteriales bacterium]|nr:hypothetical protein [Terriglobales bacterium]